MTDMCLGALDALPQPLNQLIRFLLFSAALAVLGLIVGEAIPRRVYNFESFPFARFRWEIDGVFYRRIGIQYWKDRVPDVSKVFHALFRKGIKNPRDESHMRRLVIETCNGEMVHLGLMLISPLMFWVLDGWYAVAGMLLFSLVGNLPFLLIQRYNRPRLVALMRRLEGARTPGAAKRKES